MAFNPFDSMRRNSKAILSVVTIFIMVIFVLSSGIAGGDFFNDTLPRILGGRGKNTAYAEAFGSSIRASELDQIATSRSLANEFVLGAKPLASTNVMRRIGQQLGTPGELSNEAKDAIGFIVNNRLAGYETSKEADVQKRQKALQSYSAAALASVSPQDAQTHFAVEREANFFGINLASRLEKINKEENRKDFEAMEKVLRIIRYDGYRMIENINRTSGAYFQSFTNSKNGTVEDSMNFALLLKKADAMGISFPTDIINRMIQSEMLGGLSSEDAAYVEQSMRRGGRNFTSDVLIKAIGDEFRVRAVLNAHLLGNDGRDRPLDVTPREFFEFYRDNRTELTVNLVEVPVENFLPQVTGKPTPEEARKLYEQYKSLEFSLSSETPGFRDPQKMKIEWIGTAANFLYYEQNSKVIEGLSTLAAGFMQPWGAAPATGIAQVAAPHLIESLRVKQDYDQIVNKHNQEGWDYPSDFVHDTSKLNRHTMASLVGQIGIANDPFNGLIHAPLTEKVFEHVAQTIDTRDRVRIGMPFVLAGYSPTAYNLFPAIAPAAANIPSLPSLETYRDNLREKFRQAMIGRLFSDDIENFRSQLKKIRSEKKDGKDKKLDEVRKEIDAYVQKYVKDRGILYGASTELRDWRTIHTDPGLKPLADREPVPPTPLLPNPWFKAFFARLPQSPSANTPGVLFEPRWFPPSEIDPRRFGQMDPKFIAQYADLLSDNPPTDPKQVGFLAWRSDFVAAKSWPKYDDAPAGVKLKVEEAWKLQKARELAKAEAERLASEIRTLAKSELQDKSNAPAFLNGVREKTPSLKRIELTKVSPLQVQPSQNPTIAREYSDFVMPTRDIYFPGTLRKDLLDLRTKPVGETVVVSDQPKRNFYIASVVDKQEPNFESFSTDVFARSAATAEVDDLYVRYVSDNSRNFLPTLIDRIKLEANFKPTEEYTKRISAKKESGEEE